MHEVADCRNGLPNMLCQRRLVEKQLVNAQSAAEGQHRTRRLTSASSSSFSREDQPSQRPALGSLEEGLAERKVTFGYREIEQRQKPCLLTYRGRRAGYGAWHDLDQVTVAPAIEVAEEAVA